MCVVYHRARTRVLPSSMYICTSLIIVYLETVYTEHAFDTWDSHSVGGYRVQNRYAVLYYLQYVVRRFQSLSQPPFMLLFPAWLLLGLLVLKCGLVRSQVIRGWNWNENVCNAVLHPLHGVRDARVA